MYTKNIAHLKFYIQWYPGSVIIYVSAGLGWSSKTFTYTCLSIKFKLHNVFWLAACQIIDIVYSLFKWLPMQSFEWGNYTMGMQQIWGSWLMEDD